MHRLDRRRLTLLGGALAAAGHLLAAAVDSYAVMLPVRFAVGAGEGVMLAATNATIAVTAGSARVYARCILATTVAATVGFAVCPVAITAWGHRGAHGCVAVVVFLALLASLVYVPVGIRGSSLGRAFLASSVAIVAMIALAGLSLYPRLVPSSTSLDHSLTIANASSTERTLTTMLIIALLGMPLVLWYTIFIYRSFKGKVQITEDSY